MTFSRNLPVIIVKKVYNCIKERWIIIMIECLFYGYINSNLQRWTLAPYVPSAWQNYLPLTLSGTCWFVMFVIILWCTLAADPIYPNKNTSDFSVNPLEIMTVIKWENSSFLWLPCLFMFASTINLSWQNWQTF